MIGHSWHCNTARGRVGSAAKGKNTHRFPESIPSPTDASALGYNACFCSSATNPIWNLTNAGVGGAPIVPGAQQLRASRQNDTAIGVRLGCGNDREVTLFGLLPSAFYCDFFGKERFWLELIRCGSPVRSGLPPPTCT